MNADPICVHPRESAVNELGHMGQQLALNYCNLSINHSEDVELTAASKGKVLHRVCNCFRFSGVLHRSHKHKQSGRRLTTTTTDYLCQCFYLSSVGIVFVCILAAYEICQPRIVCFQSVTENRTALIVQRRIV